MKITVKRMFEPRTGHGKKGPWTLYTFAGTDEKIYKIWERKWNKHICDTLTEGTELEPTQIKEEEYNGKISYTIDFSEGRPAAKTMEHRVQALEAQITELTQRVANLETPL